MVEDVIIQALSDSHQQRSAYFKSPDIVRRMFNRPSSNGSKHQFVQTGDLLLDRRVE